MNKEKLILMCIIGSSETLAVVQCIRMYRSYQNKTYLSRTFYIASDLQGITLKPEMQGYSLSPPNYKDHFTHPVAGIEYPLTEEDVDLGRCL